MSRPNAARAAPAETVRDPRKADLCGAAIKQLNTQARGRRQARVGAVSIYIGRALLGRVEPAGVDYVARGVNGKRLGRFARYDAAVAAVTAHGAPDRGSAAR
jgi:hypothetical protein